MTIVREGSDLTLVNSVRLSPEGEAELEALGNVKHLVRIGAFHGADDPYYLHRYGTELWAPPKMRHAPGIATSHELVPGHAPLARAGVFVFEKGKRPEAALLLGQDGGILITTDSYQNWTTFEGCSLIAKLMTRAMGFGPAVIGGPWTKAMGRGVREDFERLRTQPFRHLIPGHGTVLRDAAKERLDHAILRRFGEPPA
jgi:hypothetical protein